MNITPEQFEVLRKLITDLYDDSFYEVTCTEYCGREYTYTTTQVENVAERVSEAMDIIYEVEDNEIH